MRKRYIAFILVFVLLFSCPVQAAVTIQQKISKSVKKADIVLVGSSSMYRWKNAEAHLAPYSVANLGVPGSKVEDWQQYHSYISRCKPKAIVVFVGGNNIKTKRDDGAVVAKKVIKFLKTISIKSPKTKIFYISAQPTIRRWKVWGEMNKCNKLVKKWCKNQKKIDFIDIRKACLKNGKPNRKLFTSDLMHFNDKGYNYIYGKIVSANVKKYLRKRSY